jgi:hypothetical protein
VRGRVALASCAVLLAGCGGDERGPLPASAPGVGPDVRWRPPSLSAPVAKTRAVNGMRCIPRGPARFGVHLEVFAERQVVIVAPGIGIAPPRTRTGAYVRGGRCAYPLVTREPTGVIEVAPGRERTLGDLFALWGQPLSRTRLVGFRGRVEAYVGGRAWGGDPRAIPLRRHAQIVLEVRGHVPPHARYGFPPGL